MTTETTETETQKETTEEVIDTTNVENANTSENENEAEIEIVNTEIQTDEDDEDEIEWIQSKESVRKPKEGNAETTQVVVAESADLSSLKLQLEAKDKIIADLTSKLESFKGVENNPFFDAWNEYKLTTSEPVVGKFLEHIGAVSVTAQLNEEATLREYYRQQAILNGIKEDNLTETVEAEYDDYLNLTTDLKKLTELNKAKSFLKSIESSKVTEIQTKWKETNQKQMQEIELRVNKDTENLKLFLDAVEEKGVYNKRKIDKNWRKNIEKFAFSSDSVYNPELVQYTEDGQLYIPSVVDFVDYAVNHKEFKSLTKKEVQNAHVKNLEHKAIVAHTSLSAAERETLNEKELAEKKFQNAFKELHTK